jgi:hypothetical protein
MNLKFAGPLVFFIGFSGLSSALYAQSGQCNLPPPASGTLSYQLQTNTLPPGVPSTPVTISWTAQLVPPNRTPTSMHIYIGTNNPNGTVLNYSTIPNPPVTDTNGTEYNFTNLPLSGDNLGLYVGPGTYSIYLYADFTPTPACPVEIEQFEDETTFTVN